MVYGNATEVQRPRGPGLTECHQPGRASALALFACPNPDCSSFNVFGAGNLSVAEHMGKDKAIRRLYCNVCHGRFSERQSSLLEDSKLPPAEVVRIVKCFGYGLPVAATADICEVDPRTVQRLLEKGGQRAQDFHPLQRERAPVPLEAVQLDEMHGHVAGDTDAEKKGGPEAAAPAGTARQKVGHTWVHTAWEVKSRFALEMRVAPRSLPAAIALVVAVAMVCTLGLPLFLIDDHRPYPSALLQVFGHLKHRRRRHGRGRKCKPALKPPPGLLVGVVQKVRDAKGHLQKVRRKGLFGTVRQIEARIRELGIGHLINTAHLERFNGTVRGRQSRLTRRTRQVSHRRDLLQDALWIFRDVYNWIKGHGSLRGRTPAMALGLSDHVWSVRDYVCYPVHVSDLQRDIWAEQRQTLQESAVDRYFRKKTLPVS